MNIEVPFLDGNQQHYPPVCHVQWVDNIEFDDTLRYKGFSRGRSAAYFHFTRQSTGKEVTVFMKDFTDMIPFMVRGTVTAKFTFCKRGQNYGCRMVKP